MEEIKCLNCDNLIESHTGRRPKKFCSDNCRATYHAKHRPKKPKYVLRETHEAALKEIERLKSLAKMSETLQERQKQPEKLAEVRKNPLTPEEATPPKGAKKGQYEAKKPSGDTEALIAEIEAKIAAKRAEIALLGDVGYGKKLKDKYWKDITALEKQKDLIKQSKSF